MSFKTVNPTHKKRITKQFFYSWEMILVYLLIAINILLMMFVNDVYFTFGNIQTIIRCGMEISFMVLGMTFILILGEIDVSVASIMLLSAMVMGLTYENMVPTMGEAMAATTAVIAGVLAGGCCGLLNGILVSLIKMPSVITTIGTSFLFRGIVHIAIGGNFKTNFPKFFEPLAWDDIGGIIPVSLVVFLAFAIVFCIILHRSKFGRRLYLIGNNKDTANYSGIRVAKTKIIAFTIMGMTTALSAIIFVGRLGGIDYTMATGYELKVIAVVVLGGVSTLGGKGKLYGPIIATFFMAFLLKSLDLFEVQQNVQKIAIGIILILAVLIPRMNKNTYLKIKMFFTRKSLRPIEGVDIVQNINYAEKVVVGSDDKRMNKDEFIKYINTLSITSEPVDFNYPKLKVYKARLDYHYAINNYLSSSLSTRKAFKQDMLDKKREYNLALDKYTLKCDVIKELARAKKKLIKLNTVTRIDAIDYAEKDAIKTFKKENKVFTEKEINQFLKNVNYGNWDIKIKIKSTKDANPTIHKLLVDADYTITKHQLTKEDALAKTIVTLNKKRMKEKKHEKKK